MQPENACKLEKELTKEMGGRFFLNFALTAPMLPCALVTCTSSWQASEPGVQVQALRAWS